MKFQENQCLEATSGEIDDIEFDVDECYRIWLETDEQTEWVGFTPRWGLYLPATVHGVYRHGACGHLNAYLGQITNVSRVVAT